MNCRAVQVGGVADDVKVTQDSAVQTFAIRGSYISYHD
jgi:hypothetical protein